MSQQEAPRPTHPRPVRRLPDRLVDQIAAGEVVERPASVVKELVENAVDAGARRIRVEVREGGRDWIAVTDDGWGMSPADARLALERHATSKLADAADLVRIASFGFRGEALPAIASVSRLRLVTRRPGDDTAWEIRVEGGRLLSERAAAHPPGTRIEVADLFGAVPARRKFLKTPATEWGHVADWLGRAALALPAVHFDVVRDERPAVAWPAVKSPLDRIAAVLSEREAEGLVPLEATAGAAAVHGFVSRPDAHRAGASGLYLFVNARPVRDRLLRHAVLEPLRDVLPRGRFPTALVYLTLPPEAVDVNVHPAKWEVRFADPREIHRLVAGAVRETLGRRQWLGGGADAAAANARRAWGGAPAPGGGGARQAGALPPGATAVDWAFAGGPQPAASLAAEGPGGPEAAARAPEPGLRFAALPLLGQALASYLVLEGPGGLLLVDQHAAHERVIFERLRAAMEEGRAARQALLLPETVELAPGAVEHLESAAELTARMGFELERFGESAVVVRAVPALLAGRSPAALVRELADELSAREAGGGAGEAGRAAALALDARDRVLATLACHSARRAGDRLPPEEQRAILEALDTIPWAPTCPHGRPVAVPLDRAEIERRFARR